MTQSEKKIPSNDDGLHDYSISPKVVEDIQPWLLFENKKKEDIYLIGNKELDRYFTVPKSNVDIVLGIVSFFDGKHSIEWIENHYYTKKKKQIDVMSLYEMFSKSGLITDPKPAEVEHGEFEQLSIKVASFDIKKIFEFCSSIASDLVRWGVWTSLLIIAVGIFFLVRAPEVLLSSRNFHIPGFAGFLFLYAAIILCVIMHEFSHAITATTYGILPIKFEINLYLGFLLVFFLKMAGLYTLKPKQRLIVWGAGVYMNLTLGCLFIIVAHLTNLSLFYEQFLARVAFINFFIAVFNLLPLLPTDGYFIMSTVFKKANLRTRTWREFKNWVTFKQHKFKGDVVVYFILTISLIIWLLSVHLYWIIKSTSEGKPFDIRLYYPFIIIAVIMMRKLLAKIVLKIIAVWKNGHNTEQPALEEKTIT